MVSWFLLELPVHGKVPNEGTYIDYLEKQGTRSVISTKEKGKYAELDFKRLDYNAKENLSLVEINLKTGRNHQIRLQFASRNFPLYGDDKYGNDQNKTLGLFAYKLEFPHPTTKEILSFKSIPDYEPFKNFKIKP